jgi:hypothetical protein
MQMTTNSTCQYHELLGQKIAGIVHALSDSLRGIRGSSPSCRDCRDCRDFLDIRSDAEDLNEVGYLAPHLVEERLRASTDASVRAAGPARREGVQDGVTIIIIMSGTQPRAHGQNRKHILLCQRQGLTGM